jgi:PKD repeat protein
VKRDHGLRCDEAGHLHYGCAGLVVPQAAGTTTATTGTVAAGPFPDDQTFLLNSRPGAARTIYLDFDGHTTTGTSWNNSYGTNIVTPAFSTDTDATTFSPAERTIIQRIWQRVVEDFAPFNVNITTQDPGLEALRRSTSTDTAYGVRVCIGGSSSDWFGAGAGGVAYVGSFTSNVDTPCFVFTSQLSNNEKYIAEATSHEVGHTLGLYHDGVSGGAEYYQGHNGWAPIMGVGYYQNLVQWSKGEYSTPSNTQDDIAVMQNYGAPLLADQVGGTLSTASSLTGTNVNASSVIGLATDTDLFQFTTGAGSISFSAAGSIPDTNVDLQLALYDASGALLTSANPTGLSSTLSATVNAGTYYVAVDGVGTGNATTGYSDYGSLGAYALSGTLIPSGNQPPVVSLTSSTPTSGTVPLTVNFSTSGSYDPDGSIVSYDWNFGDGTPNSTLANPSHVYTTAGTFFPSVMVFDNGGLSTVKSTTITVNAPAPAIYVGGITMSLNTSRRGTSAVANVVVRNANGALLRNATVTGSWSGVVSGNQATTSGRQGDARFTSPSTINRGSFTFTVTGITLSGYTYRPSSNLETTDTISY